MNQSFSSSASIRNLVIYPKIGHEDLTDIKEQDTDTEVSVVTINFSFTPGFKPGDQLTLVDLVNRFNGFRETANSWSSWKTVKTVRIPHQAASTQAQAWGE